MWCYIFNMKKHIFRIFGGITLKIRTKHPYMRKIYIL